ncbi:MAG: T9SS type A sorting domain-containing protein [Bacteroidota bacterium]
MAGIEQIKGDPLLLSKHCIFAVLLALFSSVTVNASNYYVASTATGGGTGSQSDPWQLQEAFNSPAALANPSDTVWIWIDGGTYTNTYDAQTSFSCFTNGSVNAPIIFRNFHNERVIIDGQLPITLRFGLDKCSYTWIWGLEITNSSTADRDHPAYARAGDIECTAENIRLINLIVHDMGSGLSLWKTAKNTEAYGCIIYNIGNNSNNGGNWEGHGHGMYLQNDTVGIKNIHNNIVFNTFGYGVKVWQTTTTAALGNFSIERNIVFNGGAASENLGGVGNNTRTHNFFVVSNSAGNPITNTVIKHNYTFSGNNTPRPPVNAFGLNYGVRNMILDSNYITCQTRLGFNNTPIFDASVKDNNIIAGIPPEYGNYLWGFQAADYPQNTYLAAEPDSGLEYFILRNKYQSTRSHIVIYNWAGADSVQIDLTKSGLMSGDSYELINVMDFYSDMDSGTVSASGAISIAMAGHTFAPVTGSNKPSVSQFPKFGVFVIRKIDSPVASVVYERSVPGDLNIYPNPSNTGFNVKFNSDHSGQHQIFISDARGKLVSKPRDAFFTHGNHEITIDMDDLPAGVYFIMFKDMYGCRTGRVLLKN